MRKASTGRAGILPILAGAVICYGSVPLFLKHFTGCLDAWTVNGVRYAIGALVWLPFVLGRHRDVPAGRNPWRDALAPAAVNLLGQVGWALAPYYVDAGVMAFVIRSSFLFTILFGFWMLPGERALAGRASFWFGVALSIGGIVLMYAGGRGGRIPLAGWGVILFTAVFWGLYGVSVRRWMTGYPARLSFGIIALYTAVGLAALMFLKGNWRQVADISPVNAALLVASALLGIAVAHILLYTSIAALGPVIADGALLATPFVSAIGAYFLLGERMVGGQWLGGCAIILGSVLLLVAKQRSGKTQTVEPAD